MANAAVVVVVVVDYDSAVDRVADLDHSVHRKHC